MTKSLESRKQYIERNHTIKKDCEEERIHPPVPKEAKWELSAQDVLAFRQWLQFQYQTFISLQKEIEDMYLQGKTDEDGLSVGYAVSAYRRAHEMLEDIIQMSAIGPPVGRGPE